MSKKTKLTRRRALAGLGTIGAGAVIGGAGTMALFTDEENVGPTELQAGTLDLQVKYKGNANRDIKGPASFSNRPDGEYGSDITGDFTLGDLKPGDSGYLDFCLIPRSNPSWVWMTAELTNNTEGSIPEPEMNESSDGSVGGASDDGELAQAIRATLKYDDGRGIHRGSLQDVLNHLNGGLRLAYSSDQGYFPAEEERCVIIDWHIPDTVGNEIQGDELKFDVGFTAEQRRHNGSPSNPYNSTSS